jgi:dihydrofolate synthase/folylpolyglutamate synthase
LDYRGSIDRLLTLVDHERTTPAGPRQKAIHDLRRMEALLERLGDPQRQARTVHVAGTKGKGSTAAFCDAALHAAGYRTGFYSSPHLHSFRERIRRDTQPVSKARFAGLVEQMWPHLEWVSQHSGLGRVTLFEMMTGMGFHCFAGDGVDFQTVEVGLGGRLDATNVVIPDVAVVTSISRDHTAVLGDSLAQIAGEKAGIIKPGAVVVVAPQSREVLPVIDAACRRMDARPVHVGTDVTWEGGTADSEGQCLRVRGRLDEYDLRIPLLGSYQMENAATAVAALEVLREQSHSISAEAIHRGFANTVWPCRMEVLSRSPLVVADGAHNLYSMDALLASLPRYLSYRRLVLVAGFSRDKSVAEMVRRLAAARPLVFATGSRHPRSLAPSVVAARFQALATAAFEVPTPRQAIDEALEAAGPEDLVLATGSLFLAAEVREAMLGIEPETYPGLLPADQQTA